MKTDPGAWKAENLSAKSKTKGYEVSGLDFMIRILMDFPKIIYQFWRQNKHIHI